MDLQVAFQGGGAKLCDLLASAEALQSMKDEVNVVRVAGTSAGAIVACLFATGLPIAELRRDIALKGATHLPRIVKGVSKWTVIWNVLLGKPIFHEPAFAEFLQDIFTYEKRAITKFKDLKCPVLITATDIRTGDAVVYKSEGNADMSFLNSVLDSCALPFIFRNGVVGSSMIDGGLCENLPVGALMDRSEPILGISFKRKKASAIGGTRGYVEAMIDTMLEHSVSRAKELANSVFEIETEISTLDFDSCLKTLGSAERYQKTLDYCKASLKARIAEIQRQPVRVTDNQLMTLVHDVHERQHQPSDLLIERASKRIIANGLLPSTAPQSELHDEIIDTLILRAKTDSVRSLRLGSASKYGDTRSLRDWRLLNNAGARVNAVPIPVQVESRSDAYVIFFFGRGLSPAESPYTIERHSGQKHALDRLKQNRSEYVGIKSSQASVVERQELIVYLPTAYSRAILQDGTDDRYPLPDGVSRPTKSGREMTQAELDAHPAVAGFVSKGWIFSDIAAGDRAGVIILPINYVN